MLITFVKLEIYLPGTSLEPIHNPGLVQNWFLLKIHLNQICTYNGPIIHLDGIRKDI